MKNNLGKGIVIGIGIAFLSLLVFASATPGSSEDPIVTMSYVEKRVQAVYDELKTLIGQAPTSQQTSSPSIYQAKTFDAGTRLFLGEGTEIILRRGDAHIVDPTGNGIPDLTAGEDIFDGTPVPQNHVLLSPREDGRGIKASTKVTLMIKGTYVLMTETGE